MRLRLFGTLEVRGEHGDQLRVPTRKAGLVLSVLAIAGARGLRREAVAELIWPDRGGEQARASLRQALTAVRKVLAEAGNTSTVIGDAASVRLFGPDSDIDVRAFDRLADSTAPDDLAQAAELYRGDLLEEFALDGPFERWVGGYRAAFHRRALAVTERLSTVAGTDEQICRAADALATRLLARDPAAEEAHRALIRIFLGRGQRNAALRQLDQCRAALNRELDTGPEPGTLVLIEENPDQHAVAHARPDGPRSTGSISPRPGAPPTRQRPSLVVLPFDNLSGPEDNYFVDGVVEEITSALSRVRDFFVVARQSAFTFKGRFVDVREVGRELGVRYAIEGTVRRGGERVRITVQLVDAETRTQLWSQRYEGTTADIFALQDAIAAQVAGAIHPTLRAFEIEVARRKPPDSVEAHDLVLRALPHFWAHTREDNTRAIEFLVKALERDPTYGEALALKAWCHAQQTTYLWTADPNRDREVAVALAGEAAKRVEDHPTALISIGAAYSLATMEQELAASYIERALAIDPNHAWGWLRLGWTNVYRGRPDGAIEQFERALALSPLDPLSFNVRFGLAAAWAAKGEFKRAIALAEQGLRANPGAAWAHRLLAWIHAKAGDKQKSAEAVRLLLAEYPGLTISVVRAAIPPSILASNSGYLAILEEAGIPSN